MSIENGKPLRDDGGTKNGLSERSSDESRLTQWRNNTMRIMDHSDHGESYVVDDRNNVPLPMKNAFHYNNGDDHFDYNKTCRQKGQELQLGLGRDQRDTHHPLRAVPIPNGPSPQSCSNDLNLNDPTSVTMHVSPIHRRHLDVTFVEESAKRQLNSPMMDVNHDRNTYQDDSNAYGSNSLTWQCSGPTMKELGNPTPVGKSTKIDPKEAPRVSDCLQAPLELVQSSFVDVGCRQDGADSSWSSSPVPVESVYVRGPRDTSSKVGYDEANCENRMVHPLGIGVVLGFLATLVLPSVGVWLLVGLLLGSVYSSGQTLSQ